MSEREELRPGVTEGVRRKPLAIALLAFLALFAIGCVVYIAAADWDVAEGEILGLESLGEGAWEVRVLFGEGTLSRSWGTFTYEGDLPGWVHEGTYCAMILHENRIAKFLEEVPRPVEDFFLADLLKVFFLLLPAALLLAWVVDRRRRRKCRGR